MESYKYSPELSLIITPSIFLRLWPPVLFLLQSAVGSGSWQRVNAQTAVRSPRYAVFDLAEGKSYVFRVLSANKHGLSDPSEITPPIQAQDMIGKLWHTTRIHDRLKIRCHWYHLSERIKILEHFAHDFMYGVESIHKWWRDVPILWLIFSVSPKVYPLFMKPKSGLLFCLLRQSLTI